MAKYQRNEPCLCGSGKKYKKCCMAKDTFAVNKDTVEARIASFLSKQNKGYTLSIIGALCASPKNHGKNVRLERLAWYAAKYCSENITTFDKGRFMDFVHTYFASDPHEDPVDSFFTADVAFGEGSMVVFPGIEPFSYEILGRLVLLLYTPNIEWPAAFKDELEGVIQFILRVSQAMALQGGYHRYALGTADERPIHFMEQISDIHPVCYISRTLLTEQQRELGLQEAILKKLVTTPTDLQKDLLHPDDNPLIYKPFVAVGDDYVLAVPTTVLTSLNRLIFSQSKQYNLYNRLLIQFTNYNWERLLSAFSSNGWERVSIPLPQAHEALRDVILKFDADKHAYLLYIPDKVKFSSKTIDERIKVVYDYHDTTQPNMHLALGCVVIGASGEQYGLSLSDLPGDMQFVQFINYDLEKILSDPDTHQLTLWKYAKARHRAIDSFLLHSWSGVDLFALFKQNGESFFHPDEASPTGKFISSGEGFSYVAERTQFQDRHSVVRQIDSVIGYLPVKRWTSYGPIYTPIYRSRDSNLVLEHFDSAIWVTNSQAVDPETLVTANHFGETILYWLLQMGDRIEYIFSVFSSLPLEINLRFDAKMIENNISQEEYHSVIVDETKVSQFINDSYQITVLIPWQLTKSVSMAGNLAERQLMQGVLTGLNELYNQQTRQFFMTTQALSELLQSVMHNPLQRMILPRSVHDNPKADARWITTSPRDISDAEINYLLESLTSYLTPGRVIPAEIATVKEKNDLCHEIVTALVNRLDSKLDQFETDALLEHLMQMHEAVTHEKEYNETRIPARIACFSDYRSEVNKLRRSQNNLTTAGMITRCLIEFAAAIPRSGTKPVNDDDIDELLAIVEQIVNWGTTSDILNMGFDDMWMGLLPSGRIGTDKAFYNEYLNNYKQAYTEEQVSNYMDTYAALNNKSTAKNSGESPLFDEINAAFAAQFGVSLRNHLALHWAMADVARQQGTSVLRISEKDLFTQVSLIIRDYTEDMFHASLHMLTLKSRSSLGLAPSGYKNYDVFPWRLNRELSFLRRPVYRNTTNSESYYLYGFRHLWAAGENLMSIIYSGRFNDPKYKKMKQVLGQINDMKGKKYRNEVCQWLTQNTSWQVISHEVEIPPESMYGDIDVLAWDASTKIIYSIECKNTVPARNVYEMKGELDKYLGEDGQSGMIQKHVRRDEWLRQHTEQACVWLKADATADITIKSIILTSFELPAGYITQKKPPLPIVSFRMLKNNLQSGTFLPA